MANRNMQPCTTLPSTLAIATYCKKGTKHTKANLSLDQLSLDHQYERVDPQKIRNDELSLPEDNIPGGYLPRHSH